MSSFLAVLFFCLVLVSSSASKADVIVDADVSPGRTSLPQSQENSPPGKPITVRYPIRESGGVNEWIFSYFEELLTLIMSRSGARYTLEPVLLKDNALNRNTLYLQQGGYDVSFLSTSAEREAVLRPIRIPIYRGLIGWRLLFVTREGQQHLKPVESLKQLAQFYAGQGYTWPDTKVLQAAGLRVRTAVNHYSLFQMLEAGRIDYFPRSIIEIQNELEFVKGWAQIENHLVVTYPAAYYLFVSKENERLANLLEIGFEKAIADGSMFQLFVSYFRKPILSANLESRRVLYLKNQVIPKQTPTERKELWFDVDEIPVIQQINTPN